MTSRRNETARLTIGQKITYSGFPGTVIELYDDGETEGSRLYVIRVPGGRTCVGGSEIIPVENA